MSQIDYLNAMGISTWVVASDDIESQAVPSKISSQDESVATGDHVVWTFIVDQLSGDANILFDKMLASLMLKRGDIQLLSSADALAGKVTGQVAVAMGSELGKKLLQLQEPFDELRGSVHSLELNGEELPVILSYHPEYLLRKPADKACAWQDLILARSLVG